MYRLMQFSVLVVVLSNNVYGQKCSDCINYDRCPTALDLALYQRNDESKRLFKEASCGFDQIVKVPKVCCSMFSLTNKRADTIETPEDIRIANHKNLHLLPEECGIVKGDRIVGGDIADLYEFPWMTLIYHRTRDGYDTFKCGGSIINKRYILTAAHCVKNKIVAGVRIGEYDRDNEIDCQKGHCESHIQEIGIEKPVIHEKYSGLPTVVNDIALLRVAADIDFNHRNVNPICLPIKRELRYQDLSGSLAVVTGWGITENHTESALLRKVNIPIQTAQQCSELYNRFSRPGQADVTTNQLCAGTQNKDSCNGDSGGPLILEEEINDISRYVQYGVVSHGPQHCGSDFPGVYTDVTKFVGWILDNISP